jgi:hypothetical protein
MSDKLDGSFSGLWTCELCGHTGAECTCEHFARGTWARGPDKTLSEAEMASEYWRGQMIWFRSGNWRDYRIWESIVNGTDYREEMR